MAASKNARKRQAPGTVSLQCPKRKAPAENSPTLTEIEDRASTIRCVYVRRVRKYATRRPKYASWRNKTFPDAAFLVVGGIVLNTKGGSRSYVVDAVAKDSRGKKE